MKDFSGKTVLVTGSASGIGEGTVRAFAAAGASVVVNSLGSVDAGTAIAESLPDAIYVKADVSQESDCQRLITATTDRFGRLDVLVNNAGFTKVIPYSDLDAATDEVWERIWRTNVMGTWYMSRAAVEPMRSGGGGSIINITSVAGLRAIGSSIPYGTSKAALNQMTVFLAKALGPDIRVNAVAPGLIDTPWTADWDDVRATVQRTAPLRRSGTPTDVAEACLGVARADYMTGNIMRIDGGLTL